MSVDLRGLSTIAGYRTAGVLPWEPPQGVAYEAVAPNGRQVDLLVVPGEGPNFASRFLAEAEALRDAEQEHLPRVLDLGEADECLYFATAQARGDSLRQLLEEEGSLSPMRAVRLLGDAADALDAAHAAGVLHRALSPSSVLIRERPLHDTLLRGFALGLSPADPRPGQDQGPYVSPEEARGEPAMRASDIYSFACILLECFTGSPPANGELPAGLPAGLEEPLARGLSPRIVDRPRTAAELVADAARAVMAAHGGAAPAVVGNELVPAAPTALVTEKAPGRTRGLGARVPAGIAALAIGAAAIGGWLVGKPASGNDAQAKLSSGVVELTPAAGWQETRPAGRLGSLPLRHGVAATGREGARVDAGLVPGALPARVADRVSRRPGRPAIEQLDGLQAYVWRDLRDRSGGRPMTLFAAGTDSGLVVVACRGPAPGRRSCEQRAGSLAVPSSVPVVLSEMENWTARLDRAMGRLNHRRRAGRARLRAAQKPGTLAGAARGLGSAYADASSSLSGQQTPIGADSAQGGIVRALQGAAASYRELARVVRHGKGAAYRAALRSISARETSLKQALQRL